MSKNPRASIPNRFLNDAVPDEVLQAIDDPARLTPMLAGSSYVRVHGRDGTLTVRTALEDIDVQAPSALLDKVFALCDGTRTIQEILPQLSSDEERREFAEFVEFLLEQGALIDANLASAQAARYAFQFSPFGLAADAALTDKICRRFLWNAPDPSQASPVGQVVKVPTAPLAPYFDKRVTTYTYDDASISADILYQLLWSIAGVVRVDHPRIESVCPQRTLASAGGMHLVEVYVALRRAIGAHAPGVYRVRYPGERVLALELVSAGQDLIPLAFSKPWELTYATGAIFLAGDPVIGAMRYRSRSLQYLFMEAGAALHNGALSADALQLGYATIGGYYEAPIAQMCGLQRQLVLGSAVFGAKPTAEQVRMVSRSPNIDFAWVNGASARFSMGFHLARAKVKTANDDRPHTWGRGVDPWLAMIKAIAEAVEREGYREPRDIVEGRLEEVAGAMDPRRFIAFRSSQYADSNFGYQPFDATHRYAWAAGTDLVTGNPVRVLAELIYSRASLNACGHATDRPYAQVTSSGCAASTTREDATVRAILEVVERDAFMRHWLAQEPGQLVRLDGRSKAVKAIAKRVAVLEAAGCRVSIQHLRSDWAHVALVAAQHDGQHFTTMGTAAAADFGDAVESALDELEARVYAWIHGHAPSISKPDQVVTTEHHFEIYGLKAHFRRADRVLFPESNGAPKAFPRALPEQTVETLVKRFARQGVHPIALDITPRQNYVDQGRSPLSVVKVLIPGLLPISFGHRREPLGMVSHSHPAAKFPHPFP